MLDPDIVLRADYGAATALASRKVHGAAAVAKQALTFSRLGGPELVRWPADPERLRRLDLAVLPD
ncbi:hypothetical protein [Polyangium jinanense]|uniref:Uncharacterized protein n=1 Tax=Polyangium jinanense TaxID=2829994 RepID=A0A9X4AX74_9BACT|nr:hypothetical protein [Polyangium jinanense]MDC3959786.1 hypothetical protein [Polyangium jinanense]MDC3988069.1 hypothetical protein [Polyangium jinanense]